MTPRIHQSWVKRWQTGGQVMLIEGETNPFTTVKGSALVSLLVGWDWTREIPVPQSNNGIFRVATDGKTDALIHDGAITAHISGYPTCDGETVISMPAIEDGTGGSNGQLVGWIVEIPGMEEPVEIRDVQVVTKKGRGHGPWLISTGPQVKAGDMILALGFHENTMQCPDAGLGISEGWERLKTWNNGADSIPSQIAYRVAEVDGSHTVSFSTTDDNKFVEYAILVTIVPIKASVGAQPVFETVVGAHD